MRQYQEAENGDLRTPEGQTEPKQHEFSTNQSGRVWQRMRDEVLAGDAELIAFDHDAKAVQDAIDAERLWRDGELARVDIEIRKAEDLLEAFDATNFRRYAVLLRDWPEHANFPDPDFRPTSP